jgi:hypothetical protein
VTKTISAESGADAAPMSASPAFSPMSVVVEAQQPDDALALVEQADVVAQCDAGR